jgi:hypothetical protein
MISRIPFKDMIDLLLFKKSGRFTDLCSDGSHDGASGVFFSVAKAKIDTTAHGFSRPHVVREAGKPQGRRSCRSAAEQIGLIDCPQREEACE